MMMVSLENAMLKSFVALDLETTGLDPGRDEIIEFGAVRVSDGAISGRFSEMAKPRRPIPLVIERITGIRNSDLEGKPPQETVLSRFLDFVGDSPVVMHNAEFDAGFLRAKTGGLFDNRAYDTLLLSRIVLPTSPRYDLGSVARFLEIMPLEAHRALSDAETTALVWLGLLKVVDELKDAVLSEINWLLAHTRFSLKAVFEEAERGRFGRRFKEGSVPQMKEVFLDFSHLHVKRPPAPPEGNVPKVIPIGEVVAMFGKGGVFSESLPGYEERKEQMEMVDHASEAFNESMYMMIEAGTGTGKSMAYLVPAIVWSVLNKEKVIVSTNTKNLQEQLFKKDLPFLESSLKFNFKKALLKGRGNYLCVRKFLYTLENKERELDGDERVAMLPLVVWASQTETGDIAENTGFFSFDTPELRDKIHTVGDECLGKGCRSYRNCFLWKARMEAMSADIVIVNHAVTFSDLASDNGILPPYKRIIFDEAHNIENVATDFLGAQVNKARIVRILARLFRPTRRGDGSGLLPGLLFQVSKAEGKIGKKQAEWLRERVSIAIQQTSKVVEACDLLMKGVGKLFRKGARGREEDKAAFTAEGRKPEDWDGIIAAKENLITEMSAQIKRCEHIVEAMKDEPEMGIEDLHALTRDIEAQMQFLREVIADLDFIVKASEENYVFWAERTPVRQRYGGGETTTLQSAPLNVSKLLKDMVYDKRETVIMSSATMSVGGSFEFLRSRLGFGLLDESRVRCVDVGSPFDFDEQVLVCVPTFLPEPVQDGGQFNEQLIEMMIDLFRATRGRALGLFTSYDMLNGVHEKVREALEPEGILVLCQGVSGSPGTLLQTFQHDINSVLLGTASFWEGVDVVGEALSCLLIAKLPFQVFTDPVFKARYEQVEAGGKDAFMNFSVPNAAIKLRQGFGRLIRSRRDVGVVVIADKRIATKRYGAEFAKSLPTDYRAYHSKEAMLGAIARFLSEAGVRRV
jgi:predicted DnaQ family exonuclease/DinG family helicase